MLKDYIKNIQAENEKKINSLEREMQELVGDLDCTENILEKLKHNKKIDTNIFSPRTLDTQVDEKIENAQNKINEIKQRMEYVSQMIEEAIQQKNELIKLMEEVDSFQKESESRPYAENCEISDAQTYKIKNISAEELAQFLILVYKKTETSLALLNGNKNRCKAELRSTLSLIKEYAKKVEITTES